MRLTENDYKSLERSYVSRQYADAAQLWRVDSLEGRERVGHNGSGDYAGIVFPYVDPVGRQIVGERLRLDHPPVDAKGKPEHKYLSPPGQRVHFYWPFAEKRWLEDPSIAILITEGEKKYLAAHSVAVEQLENGRPLFFTIAIAGVWAWRGRIGKANDAKGQRVDVKGVIPDFDRVEWKERRVVIAFDSNTLTNPMVGYARAHLARELEARGARVYLIDLPAKAEGAAINGIDDFIAAAGVQAFLELFHGALRWDWRSQLIKTEKGKVRANTSKNAAIALRLAPEFRDVLGWNLFAERAEIRRPTPWKSPMGPWRDLDIIRLREWLEERGICENRQNVIDAVVNVAHEATYHPVREYLENLEWDGVQRLNNWLTAYAGAAADDPTADEAAPADKATPAANKATPADFVRAIAAKWLISAVARVFEPGTKADHMLILEGPQGVGKSHLLAILGGEFFTDDMPDLTNKDAQLALAGMWIVEFPELDTINRAEASRIKSFLSRSTDRYRSPYGRLMEEHPRQCVFAGTVNRSDYGNDETGLRRYWPVACGELNLTKLESDRDQLWAEALERYREGESWWFDDANLLAVAVEEQASRQRDDPWDQLIRDWLFSRPERITTSSLLADPIQKPKEQWNHSDKSRIGAILTRMGRICKQRRDRGEIVRFYYTPEDLKREEEEEKKKKEAKKKEAKA